MAIDFITLNEGDGGAQLGTDIVGGIHYQIVKVGFGPDGSLSDVSPANPLPVTLGAGSAVKRAAIDISASGDNTVVAAVGGKKIRVLSLVLVPSKKNGVTIQDDTTPISGFMKVNTNAPLVLGQNADGHFETTVGGALVVNLANSNQVGGSLTYLEV